jgi:hypothetical protein
LGDVEIHILRRLYRHTYIGRRHMSIDDLRQGLPDEKRDMKLINRIVKTLAREGYVLLHKKGSRISLNPKVLSRVRDMV